MLIIAARVSCSEAAGACRKGLSPAGRLEEIRAAQSHRLLVSLARELPSRFTPLNGSPAFRPRERPRRKRARECREASRSEEGNLLLGDSFARLSRNQVEGTEAGESRWQQTQPSLLPTFPRSPSHIAPPSLCNERVQERKRHRLPPTKTTKVKPIGQAFPADNKQGRRTGGSKARPSRFCHLATGDRSLTIRRRGKKYLF